MAAVAKDSEISAGARRLRSRISHQYSSVEAEQLMIFASRLLARGGSAYVESLGDDELMALVGSAYRFLTGAGRLPRVRVFNPRISTDGWESQSTVIEASMEDNPFVVEALRGYLRAEGFVVRHVLHTGITTGRERDGGLTAIRAHEEDGTRESFVHIAIHGVSGKEVLSRTESDLQELVDSLQMVMRDQQGMFERVEAIAQDLEWIAAVPWVRGSAEEVSEAAAFLRWLASGNFVFVGYDEARVEDGPGGPSLETVPEASLGISLAAEDSNRPGTWTHLGRPVIRPDIVTVTRSSVDSFDYLPQSSIYEVGVHRLTADGRMLGEARFLGFFTPKGSSQDSADVPVLRRTLAGILEAEEAGPDSHAEGEIVAIFNGYPKEELFCAAPSDILEDVRALLEAPPDRIAVRTRTTPRGAWGQRFSVIVSVPVGELSTEVKERIQNAFLRQTGGAISGSRVGSLGRERVCLHLTIDAGEGAGALADVACESEVAAIINTWDDQLLARLGARYPTAEARRIAARFCGAFPADYLAAASLEETLGDVSRILELERSRTPQVALTNVVDPRGERVTELRVYRLDGDLVPSELVAVLANLGLGAHAKEPVVVRPGDGSPVFVHRFYARDRQGERLDLDHVRGRLEAAILAIGGGEIEDDMLNSLVLTTDLDWRTIDCLRTFCGYGWQIGLTSTRGDIYAALVAQPTAARALVDLFCARFAPDGQGDPGIVRERFAERVERIKRPADALILGRLGAIVEATTRTNFFRPLKARRPHVAIKVDSSRLDWVPRPFREIYVQNSRMEGMHLRSGRAARGSIVHCASRDGLRTDLLALLTRQELSAAAAVPSGAAGGFVVKQGHANDPSVEEIREAYATLVRGILDLTDNRVAGTVRRPQGQQIYDEDSPYLVITSAEGDSTFGGLANAIATEYDFWLGDAFASSGSLPEYDANRLGIKAQAAWECVRAHLKEAGRILDDPIVVVGTGDMTDDFFGKGMLLSPSVELRAALSGRYIFLDPNPEPGASFLERERLARERLGWEGYDTSKLGQGGMIVSRAAGQVQLSPEASAFLGLGESEISPERLTQAILGAQADVMWSGGLGAQPQAGGGRCTPTSSGQTFQVEVDGRALRAAVVAESDCASLSHRARVDYALSGGRLNSAALDSAGGGYLADREVNLKVLFQPLLESGELSRPGRDEVLEEVAGAVVGQVLSRVRSQHRVLSFDQWRSQRCLAEYREAVAWLSTDPAASAALDVIPDRDTLRARRARYPGLTRPELSAVLACAKNVLKRLLLDSPGLLDDPACEPFLSGYFPHPIPTEFEGPMREHVLRREMIAAELSNQLVDTSGCTFVHRLVRDAGVGVAEVVRAWVIAFEVADIRNLVDCLWPDGDEEVLTGEATIRVQDTLMRVLERLAMWIFGNVVPDRAMCDVIRGLKARLADMTEDLPGCFSSSEAEAFHRRAAEFEMIGVREDLSRRLAFLECLDGALDVAATAAEAGVRWREVAKLFYGLGAWLDFPWLSARIAETDDEDFWQHRAARALAEDLARARCRLVYRLYKTGATRAGLDSLGTRRGRAEKVLWMIADLKGSARVSPAALQVVVHELGRLGEVE